jgi:hypothetical protein
VPLEARGQVENSLAFNGNGIDIILNFSTTKDLITILTLKILRILGTILGYRTYIRSAILPAF